MNGRVKDNPEKRQAVTGADSWKEPGDGDEKVVDSLRFCFFRSGDDVDV